MTTTTADFTLDTSVGPKAAERPGTYFPDDREYLDRHPETTPAVHSEKLEVRLCNNYPTTVL
jgi:hypothetical protein